jgi:hypothetical protein
MHKFLSSTPPEVSSPRYNQGTNHHTSCEYVVANPCSGSLFLAATSALFREEIQREHTATLYPKPTEENGLPRLPRGEATVACNQQVVFNRCAVWNDTVEADLVAKTARVRLRCEEAQQQQWPAGLVVRINDTLPVFYAFDGEVHLIMFAKHLIQGMPLWWGDPNHSVCYNGYAVRSSDVTCVVHPSDEVMVTASDGMAIWTQFCTMAKPPDMTGRRRKTDMAKKRKRVRKASTDMTQSD